MVFSVLFPNVIRLIARLFLIVALGFGSALAQDSGDPSVQQEEGAAGPTPGQPITREDLLSLIANEIVLAPGVGLRNVRLGESLASVQSRLGPPASVSRSGVLPRLTNLTYILDGGTVVVLAGREVIERISVRGNAAALVRTVQGARFGMDPNLIQRIYREPTRVRDNRLEYRDRGITFYFGGTGGGQTLSDGVSQIVLYPRAG